MSSNQPSLEEIERYWGSLEIYNEEQRRSGLEVFEAEVFGTAAENIPQNLETGRSKVETVVSTKVRSGLRQYLGLGLIKLGQWVAHHPNSHNI